MPSVMLWNTTAPCLGDRSISHVVTLTRIGNATACSVMCNGLGLRDQLPEESGVPGRRERRRARYGMIIISDRCRSTPHYYGGFAFRENEKQRLPTARLNAVLCCREQSIIMTTCASTTYCAARFPLIRAKIESTLTHPLLAASTVSLAKVATSRVLRTRRKAQRRAKSEWRSIN